MWNDTKVTELLNIKYPIIQAGMAGGITTPELVASVSNNGALGNIGAGYMDAEQLRESIKQTKQLTQKPFGINLFIPETPDVMDEEINRVTEWLQPFYEKLNIPKMSEVKKPSAINFEHQINILLEEEIAVCSFTFGLPSKEVVRQLKAKNITLIGTATTVQEAIANEQIGMDIVVMQGSEAGGHRGTFLGPFEEAMIGTMALIPQTVDQVNIPIIAAGGINDGRGILSSLLLGAQAVQIGTMFVTSVESGAQEQHKTAIINGLSDETIVTSTFSGKPARGIYNDFIYKMEKYEGELPKYPILNTLTQPVRREAAAQGRSEWMSLWCGQNPYSSKEQTAGEMIAALVTQVNNIIHHKIKKW